MKPLAAIAGVAAILLSALPARAEIVVFGSGRTLSVKDHHTEGDSLVLSLRGGGEIVCNASVVSRIDPDEVPYPEPDAPRVAEAAPAPSGLAPGLGLGLAAVPSQYNAIIDRVSREQGVPATLVRAVIQVESAYRENARSPKGAMGLMQLMPETARLYAVSNPYDPAANIEAGIKHLKSLLQRFPRPLALAAYNAGEAAVLRFGGIPPYAETRTYVSRILKLVG